MWLGIIYSSACHARFLLAHDRILISKAMFFFLRSCKTYLRKKSRSHHLPSANMPPVFQILAEGGMGDQVGMTALIFETHFNVLASN